jgi:hypothetical protein
MISVLADEPHLKFPFSLVVVVDRGRAFHACTPPLLVPQSSYDNDPAATPNCKRFRLIGRHDARPLSGGKLLGNAPE